MNLVVDFNVAQQLYRETSLFNLLWRNLTTLNDKSTLHPVHAEDEELWSVSEKASVVEYEYLQDV